tara:strand:- start:537 stop:1718 length:1182 start_codon:yes stop_codon:yes gene_type:complete
MKTLGTITASSVLGKRQYLFPMTRLLILCSLLLFAAVCGAKDLGEGYSRDGEFIFFEGKRIDQEGAHDIDKFSRAVGRKLTLCSNVDAASFQVLSEEYTKDKNKVYYKWISPGRFWVVELSKTNPATFESVSFNLARDKNHAWYYGKILPGVDATSLQIVDSGFVWKDDHHVWYKHKKIAGADPATFKHLEHGFYRDAENVYWCDTVLKGADPHTFRTFGENSSYGADKNRVWGITKPLPFLDAPTFDVVHQSVYKDKNGVYAKGIRLDQAEPKTFRKIVDLDQHFNALLADGKNYFIFLRDYRGEVFRLEDRGKSLYISRPIHPIQSLGDLLQKQIAVSSGELTKTGWVNQKVVPVPKLRNRDIPGEEKDLMKTYQKLFSKAWDIIRAQNSD